jgi:hypothetical protein
VGGFSKGNKDGKHYWLTPPALMHLMQSEFQFDFDACPYPKPPDFDGLILPWGKKTYVNPPFGSIIGSDGKKKGPTAWAKKSLHEAKYGNEVVLVYPIDKWVLMLLTSPFLRNVKNLGDVRWCAIEDGSPGKGIGRHTALFHLGP